MGIDLKQKLEATGRIKAEDYFKAKMPHLWKEYDLDLDRSHTMKAYVDSHRSLHPLIIGMHEALEKMDCDFKTIDKERHMKLCRKCKALAELKSYLEGL